MLPVFPRMPTWLNLEGGGVTRLGGGIRSSNGSNREASRAPGYRTGSILPLEETDQEIGSSRTPRPHLGGDNFRSHARTFLTAGPTKLSHLWTRAKCPEDQAFNPRRFGPPSAPRSESSCDLPAPLRLLLVTRNPGTVASSAFRPEPPRDPTRLTSRSADILGPLSRRRAASEWPLPEGCLIGEKVAKMSRFDPAREERVGMKSRKNCALDSAPAAQERLGPDRAPPTAPTLSRAPSRQVRRRRCRRRRRIAVINANGGPESASARRPSPGSKISDQRRKRRTR